MAWSCRTAARMLDISGKNCWWECCAGGGVQAEKRGQRASLPRHLGGRLEIWSFLESSATQLPNNLGWPKCPYGESFKEIGSHLLWMDWVILAKDEYGDPAFYPTFPWTICNLTDSSNQHLPNYSTTSVILLAISFLNIWSTHPHISDTEHFLEHYSLIWSVEQVASLAHRQEKKSKHFCPLYLGIGVTKGKPTQSSTVLWSTVECWNRVLA